MIFEGRDSAGKGGVIKRITQRLNPRVCRVAALPAPNERERTQWYFQRYAAHLPAGGEIVLFDRSWYNRAGVERVMGFCTDEQVRRVFQVGAGIRADAGPLRHNPAQVLVLDHRRGAASSASLMRIHDPLKQWKLSPMDVQARARWEQYTKAKEIDARAHAYPEAPWWVVEAVDKKRSRLNCINHLLSQIPYDEVSTPAGGAPPRVRNPDYHRGPVPKDMYVPAKF